MDFRFVSRTTFDGLAENRKLAPGTFYFLEEKEFHIAIDDDQYLTYGNGVERRYHSAGFFSALETKRNLGKRNKNLIDQKRKSLNTALLEWIQCFGADVA
jgi:hypothetical protein